MRQPLKRLSHKGLEKLSGSEIQRHHLTEAITTVPNDLVLKSAGNLISPLFDRMLANSLESRTLAQVRDLLLPKLMSGEIRLKDAETAVEAVA